MTYKGFDLTPLLGGLITILSSVLAWVALKVKGAAESAKEQNNAQAALLRVGVIATTLLGKAWDKLGPQIQAAIADGKVTDEERAALEAAAKDLALGLVGEDELSALASALGLPLPGLIAKLASMMLDTFTKAHDASTPAVSKLAFPVSTEPAYSDAG